MNEIQGSSIESPTPVNSDAGLMSRLESMVSERMKGIESQYDAKIKALEARYIQQLKAARGVPPVDHHVPQDAGGIGTEIHANWGQYYQELARDGKLTEAHIRASEGLPPVEETAVA